MSQKLDIFIAKAGATFDGALLLFALDSGRTGLAVTAALGAAVCLLGLYILTRNPK